VYGIGKGISRSEWQAYGRELIRLGLIEQVPGKFATVTLSAAGIAALRARTPITLTRHVAHGKEPRRRTASTAAGAIPCDERLLAQLKKLRRAIADERAVPAYVVFSDVTLREIAARLPTTLEKFSAIPGVGAVKLADFGRLFIEEVSAYLSSK
jgi:ATP-dependent DNA helicase RecQ